MKIHGMESSFENCTCQRTTALTSFSSFSANGGALYVALTVFHTAIEFSLARPEVINAKFRNNHVLENGAGGAIFWSVPPSMFEPVTNAGGLIRLVGYDDLNVSPLACQNAAMWGGDFIATSAMGLVAIRGPSKFAGASTTTEVFCPNVETTGLCPYRCSGAMEDGRQWKSIYVYKIGR